MSGQNLDSGPNGAEKSFVNPILELTVEEKVKLLSGLGDFRTIAGVERHGITPLKVSRWPCYRRYNWQESLQATRQPIPSAVSSRGTNSISRSTRPPLVIPALHAMHQHGMSS